MKKYFFPIIFSLFLGVFMAYLIINSYESLDGAAVSAKTEKVFFIQRGVYSSLESMNEAMSDFTDYIYGVEDNMYHCYVGLSLNSDNASKIVNVYKSQNIDTIVKEKVIEYTEFIDILSKYDEILSKTDDFKSIQTINNQVLAKYEEEYEER